MNKIFISTSSFDVTNSAPILDELRKNSFEILLNPYGRRLTEAEVIDHLKGDVVGIIAGVEPLTRKVFENAVGLKVISRCGIGLDNVDLEAAKQHDITVFNTPAAPVAAVAELTVGLILSLLRRIPEADRNLRKDQWKSLMGHLLSAQIIGIIGYGRIGRKVVELLQPFGCRIIFYDVNDSNSYPGLQYVELQELLKSSDIVSIHVSSSKQVLGKNEFNLMKEGSWLINLSRGGVVDECALYEYLKSGHLSGAALDVFEKEPYSGKLKELDNVILTPHMGSYAKEARKQMENEAVINLKNGLIDKGFMTKEGGR